MEYILIFISAIFVNNIVLSQFLGICPFLGVSKKIDTSLGMSAAVAFVLTLAACSEICARCLRLAVSADHRLHPRHRLIGADGGDCTEEGFTCTLPGIRNLPAADHHQLCSTWCSYPCDSERLQSVAVCGLCLLYSHWFRTGIDCLCRYA